MTANDVRPESHYHDPMKVQRAPTLLVTALLVLSLCTATAARQAVQPGTVSDPVRCANDPTQSYALFLPSSYSSDRKWTVLFAFHPAARRSATRPGVSSAELPRARPSGFKIADI